MVDSDWWGTAARPEGRGSSIGESRPAWVGYSILLAVTFVLYLPTLSSDFVDLDDYQYVVDNPLVLQPSAGHVARFFREVSDPSTVEGYYQPLTMVSYMLDAVWSGARPGDVGAFPFHLTNILLHGLAAVAVMSFVRACVGGVLLPFGAALIFAAHPVQVEAVAWVSQRKTVLAAPFAIACLTAYLNYARQRRAAWLVLSAGLYLLANLAKPTAVLLPLAFPLLDVWPLRRPLRSVWIEKWPFVPLMLVMGWIAWRSQAGSGAGLAIPNLAAPQAILRWIGLICYNTMLYLGNLFWPMHLSPFRSIPADMTPANPRVGLSVAGVVVLIVFWLGAARRSRPLFTGLTAFLLLLAPAIGAVRFAYSCVADRFLYLPFVFLLPPLAIGLALLGQRFSRRRLLFGAVPILLAAPLAVLSHAQQGIWRDSRALWSYVVDVAPDTPIAHIDLANSFLEEGQNEAGLEHAKRGYELDPTSSSGLWVLGRALIRCGRPREGLRYVERAQNLGLAARTEGSAWLARAEAHVLLGRTEEADKEVGRAIDGGVPAFAAYNGLGQIALEYAKDYSQAVRWYDEAVRTQPDNIVARWNLGTSLEFLGRRRESLEHYEKVRRDIEALGRPLPAELAEAIERCRAALAADVENDLEDRP